MSIMSIMIQWEKFKDQMPKIDKCRRYMQINNDFDLQPEIVKEDVDQLLDSTDKCLDAIRQIKRELGI